MSKTIKPDPDKDPEREPEKEQGDGKSRDPRKPGVDPDQTPDREVEQVPVADPDSDTLGNP